MTRPVDWIVGALVSLGFIAVIGLFFAWLAAK